MRIELSWNESAQSYQLASEHAANDGTPDRVIEARINAAIQNPYNPVTIRHAARAVYADCGTGVNVTIRELRSRPRSRPDMSRYTRDWAAGLDRLAVDHVEIPVAELRLLVDAWQDKEDLRIDRRNYKHHRFEAIRHLNRLAAALGVDTDEYQGD